MLGSIPFLFCVKLTKLNPVQDIVTYISANYHVANFVCRR